MFVVIAGVLFLSNYTLGSRTNHLQSLDNNVSKENSREVNLRRPRQNFFESIQQLTPNSFLNNGNNGVFGNNQQMPPETGFANRPQSGNNVFFDNDNQFKDFVRQNIIPNRKTNRHNRPNSNNNQPVLTTQNPLTATIAIPGMGTTQSLCEDRCQTTNQYNPVCGDNNITYFNLERLRCAQRCGKSNGMLFTYATSSDRAQSPLRPKCH